MKLTLDPEFNEWLAGWNKDFDWDDGNKQKNEKHGIKPVEIEQIFENPVCLAGKILEQKQEARWLLLGELGNKEWALIVTRREAKLRVISCRRQRKTETKIYENNQKNQIS